MGYGTGLRAALGALIAIGASAVLADTATALEPAASRQRQLDRIQLHRNGARGVAYLPRSAAGGGAEPDRIGFRARSVVPLPGDGDENVRSGLYPIDADGDGVFEFVQFNGYRLMRVVREDGALLWEQRGGGRGHRSYTHRDTLAVLDVDGDRRQEIVHCWLGDGGKQLVVRSGATGRVLRSTALAGDDAGDECQIAAFRMEGREEPVIMVSRSGNVAGAGCRRNWIDLWPVTAAYGPDLRRLWQRATCDAGHYAWPLDEDGDGRAEGVFVGKYLLRADGTLACTLPNWGSDHVDSMVVADLDPASPGLEAVAVGRSGGRTYRAAACDLRAEQPGNVLGDPQHVNAALLEPASGAPSLVMRSRADIRRGADQVHLVDVRLRRRGDFREPDARHLRPMQNASLDGSATAEELVTSFGQVIGLNGRIRLDTGWYWDRDGGGRGGNRAYARWTSAPLVVDLDGDGRDEIVTWGRERLVIGELARDKAGQGEDVDADGRGGDGSGDADQAGDEDQPEDVSDGAADGTSDMVDPVTGDGFDTGAGAAADELDGAAGSIAGGGHRGQHNDRGDVRGGHNDGG